MRAAILLAALLVLGLGVVRAEEESLPIELDGVHRAGVTDAQLDWVRTWLRANLRADDLTGIDIDLRNRAHPGADYRVEARLAPRVSGTYQVQRVIRFGHSSWPTWVLGEKDFVDDWAVDDRDRVRRIFIVDGERKVMHLHRTLSYEEVLQVLRVIARDGVTFTEDGWDRFRPNVRGVYSIEREDGRIEIRSGGPWEGTWVAGRLEDDTFVVEAQGGYIS